MGRGHCRQDVLVGLAHRFGIRQVQPHPAHVELVDDLRGDDLHGHRITQILRGPGRFFRAVGPMERGHLEAVVPEKLMGFRLQEVAATGAPYLGQQGFQGLPVQVGKALHFVAGGLDTGGVAGHGAHGAGRFLREVVMGQPGLRPDSQGLLDLPQGHLADQRGLAVLRRHCGHGGGDGRQIGHQLRGGDDDGPIHLVILRARCPAPPGSGPPCRPPGRPPGCGYWPRAASPGATSRWWPRSGRRSPGRSAPRRPPP